MPEPHVPTGSQLLGKIVSAFQLHDVADPRLRRVAGKRGQRLFAQGRKVQHPCGPICLWSWIVVGTPKCDCARWQKAPQLFEPILFPRPPSIICSRLLTLSAHAHAIAWERFVRPEMSATPDLARAFLRFGTLDLAVKTAWFRRRERMGAPPADALPAWAERARRGEPLAQLLDDRRERTLKQLAEKAGVSVDALKRWRRGENRPTSEMLKVLLMTLLPEGERAAVRARLSRHYALSALAEEIEWAFGAEFVLELGRVHADVVACRMKTELDEPEDSGERVHQVFDPIVLAFSSWYLPADAFLGIAAHHAPTWQDDIRRATDLWRAPLDGRSERRELAVINWACEIHGNPPLFPIESAGPHDRPPASPNARRAGSSQP